MRDQRLGRLRDLVVGVVAEVDARLRVEAEGHGAVARRVVVGGVVVAGVLRDHGVAQRQRVRPLLPLEVAERRAEVAVRAAAAFEEEVAVPGRRQAQVEADGVPLAVDARALVDPADDLAVLGVGGRVALRLPCGVRRGRVETGGGIRQARGVERGQRRAGCRLFTLGSRRDQNAE